MTAASVARTWGATAADRERAFPCDRHVEGTRDALFRAVDVDAPPAAVFPWLCQLKVAPYSYDWIDNGGRQSPRALTTGLEALERGQRFMGMFDLVDFEPDRHVTLLAGSRAERFIGRFAVTYAVFPRGPGASRLVVKLAVQYPAGPLGWALRRIVPWADLVMMRKQLLTLKALAEERWTRSSA